MTGADLLAEWYAARGKRAPAVTEDQEKVIVAALVERQKRMEEPRVFCDICLCRTRGEHRVVTV